MSYILANNINTKYIVLFWKESPTEIAIRTNNSKYDVYIKCDNKEQTELKFQELKKILVKECFVIKTV
jgi:hypothetical protein